MWLSKYRSMWGRSSSCLSTQRVWLTMLDGVLTKSEEKSRVNPSSSIDIQQIITPSIIYGRRRPNLDLELSAMTPKCHISECNEQDRLLSPINGCTTRPEIGPAMNTTATSDFVRPSCRRYGVAILRHRVNNWRSLKLTLCKLTVRHLYWPHYLNSQKTDGQCR